MILLFLKPFSGFLFSLIVGLYIPLGIIAMIFKNGPEYIFNIDLLYATKVYLILTIWSITISIFGERFMRYSILLQEYDKPKQSAETQIEFNKSLLDNGGIKYFIFTSYFIVLIIFSVVKLNHFKIFNNEDLYLAINLSFVTFLSFDRLLSSKKLLKIMPKKIGFNLVKIWIYHLSNEGDIDNSGEKKANSTEGE